MRLPRLIRVENLERRQLLAANLVADFNGIYPTDSVTVNGESYFAANDGVHGLELWKSDGTEAGTMMVKDIVPGSGSAGITNFSVVNGRVLFFARSAANIVGLYRTDGTADGTDTIKTFGTEIPIGYWGAPNATVGGDGHQKMVFTLWKQIYGDHPADDTDQGAYSTDGTATNTVLLETGHFSEEGSRSNEDWNPLAYVLPVTNGHVLFSGDATTGDLYSTDGTVAGTITLIGIHGEKLGGVLSQSGAEVAIHSSYVGTDSATENYYVTDGTQAGTVHAIDFPLITTGYGNFVTTAPQTAGDSIYGTIQISKQTRNGGLLDTQLWAFNKVTGVKTLIKTTNTPMDVIGSVGGLLVFYATDVDHGQELWVSDGTVAGTHILQDMTPGKIGSWAGGFLEMGDISYFLYSGPDNQSGYGNYKYEMWRTDGTDAGTYRVSKTNYTSPYGMFLKEVNGKIGMVVDIAESERLVKTLVFDPTQDTDASGPLQGVARLVGGVLRVFGTEGDDVIRIYNHGAGDANHFVVNINGNRQTFSYADVSKTIVYGYGGNDDIGVSHRYGGVVLRSSIWGGAGNDTITGTDGRDTINGESGNDSILGGAGNDGVSGGTGNDTIVAGAGSDTVDGGTGSDSIDGGSGNNVMTGGQDSDIDTVASGSGADVVFGQSVYDIFYGDTTGGANSDEVLNS